MHENQARRTWSLHARLTVAKLGIVSEPIGAEPRNWQSGFWSLIVTQFEGAFNDNALKTLVTFIGLNMALPENQHKALVPVATALFSLPFILFSMTGGFFADRFSKRTVTIAVKTLEIGIMALATASF